MKIIGLTGASGGGKTSVGAILAKKGGYVIDADKIAREITEPGSSALDELVRRFGAGILENGRLNRRALGDLAFSDAEKLNALNDITHKYILLEIYNRLQKAKDDKKYKFIVIDAPLLVETGLHKAVDEVWLVRADRETAVARVVKRDGITAERAEARLAARTRLDDIETLAAKVIYNSGDMERLEELVDRCLV
jgi:dephospho-CoA kinase